MQLHVNKILIFFILLCFSSSLPAQTKKPLKEGNLYAKGILKKNTRVTASAGGGSSVGKLQEMDIVYIYNNSGSSYEIGPDANGPMGFVPKNTVQRWDTRICVHFTPMAGRDAALVFKDPGTLENCLRGAESFYDGSKNPHPSSVAQEPDDKRTSDRFSMLMPVLDRKRSRSGSSLNQLFNVGFLAGGSSTASSTSTVRPARESKIGELELMFLVDATASMTPFIDATKDIIENVTKRILKSREGGVRFGVTAYRDYIDEQDQMEYITKQFIDLTSNPGSVKSTLESVYEAEVDSEDAPEAVFDGYFASVTETSWKESPNTLRVIILIGDASGHQPGHPKNPMNYSSDLLLHKASENRVRTIAVKINSGRMEDDALSKSQFFEIAEGFTDADKGSFIQVDYPDREDDVPTQFVEKTSAQIEREINRLEKLITAYEDTRKSGSPTVKFRADVTSTDRAIILKNIKLDFGSDDPFVFSTGWLSEYDGRGAKNLETYAYMTRNEFDLMLSYIRVVDQIIKNPDMALESIIKEVLEAASGEKLEGSDLAGHYKKTLDLPAKTDILKIPITEINSWGAERKSRMIELIKDKLESLEKWENALDNWNKSPGKRGEQYTFVPLDMLP